MTRNATDQKPGEGAHSGTHEQPGAMVGRYELLQPIGEGGFGVVWLAEQREPVKRRVAVKVIKLGMDTKQVIARFEAERQALALMDHPHIAKVLDAGTTETGRPYFVMEHIEGVPILEYCDAEKLDTRARLRLFSNVCLAIQHAHQKGIIHRDIKPSNVLVAMQDGAPVPKVIDFGVAKAMRRELASQTQLTELWQIVGTPAYMSPEQADLEGLDVDTRSDVYSLGVLLYELLTGTTPFDVKSLLAKGMAEMVRTIREVEPQRPSTRISKLGDTGARAARARSMDLKKLGTLMRGDLDWIVMKCLEKDRARRYATANGLAADIQRHLADEPVIASPPSATYKLRKFVQRNRVQVIAAAFVAAALVWGAVGATMGMLHAIDERQRADAEKVKAERAAAAEAEAKGLAQENERRAQENERRALAEAQRAEKVTEFVLAALRRGDAMHAGGGQDMTILAAMENAIADIDRGRFGGDPETEAPLLTTIAQILQNNGREAQAEPLFARALSTYEGSPSADREHVAIAKNNLALVRSSLGRHAEAEALLVEVLETLQQIHTGDHDSVATALNNLADMRRILGDAAGASTLFEEALEMLRRLHAGDHARVAMALDNLAKARGNLGHREEAGALMEESLEMRRRLYSGDHPDLAAGLNNLGLARAELGRMEEAVELFEQALEMTRRQYASDHATIATSMSNLASALCSLGRLDEAETLWADALEMRRRLYPGDHPDLVNNLNFRGSLCLQRGDAAGAKPFFAEALEQNRRLYRDDHPQLAESLHNLAVVHQALREHADARRLLEEAQTMLRRVAPDGSAIEARVLWRLGSIDLAEGAAAAALPRLEAAVAMASKVHPPEHPRAVEYRKSLEACKAASGGR